MKKQANKVIKYFYLIYFYFGIRPIIGSSRCLTTYMDSQAIWRETCVIAAPAGPTGNAGEGKALPCTAQDREEQGKLNGRDWRKLHARKQMERLSEKKVPPLLL